MPNHWHLLLWPENDGDLAAFMQRLSITHSRNWQEHRRRVGYGHIYQGPVRQEYGKSFPVETDEHYYQVARYVERNALRANLVEWAEGRRWGSLYRRVHGTPEQKDLLAPWPVRLPKDWPALVNKPQSAEVSSGASKPASQGRFKPATPNPAFSFATSSFPLRLRDLCRRRMQPPPCSGGST